MACKKDPVTPAGNPIEIVHGISYRVHGITGADTAEVYLNSKKLDSKYMNGLIIKPGDSLKVHYTGNFRKHTGFDFAYWPLDNAGPSAERVVKFNAKRRTWISRIEYIDNEHGVPEGEGGKAGKDSVIVYGWRYYINETVIF